MCSAANEKRERTSEWAACVSSTANESEPSFANIRICAATECASISFTASSNNKMKNKQQTGQPLHLHRALQYTAKFSSRCFACSRLSALDGLRDKSANRLSFSPSPFLPLLPLISQLLYLYLLIKFYFTNNSINPIDLQMRRPMESVVLVVVVVYIASSTQLK